MKIQTQTISFEDTKSVLGAVDAGYTFKGYGSVFGNKDSYQDIIMPGAYSDFLKSVNDGEQSMPKLLLGHAHDSVPVGKIVRMYEDDYGLAIEAELTRGHSVAEDVRAALMHKTMEGLSIGYMLDEDDYNLKDDGGRIINKVSRLMEISIVTFAANEAAKIDLSSVKSLDTVCDIKSFENFLKDSLNCSNAVSKKVIAKAKIALAAEKAAELKAKEENEAVIAAAIKLFL